MCTEILVNVRGQEKHYIPKQFQNARFSGFENYH